MFSSWSCMEGQRAVVSEHFLYLDLILNLSYCRVCAGRDGFARWPCLHLLGVKFSLLIKILLLFAIR